MQFTYQNFQKLFCDPIDVGFYISDLTPKDASIVVRSKNERTGLDSKIKLVSSLQIIEFSKQYLSQNWVAPLHQRKNCLELLERIETRRIEKLSKRFRITQIILTLFEKCINSLQGYGFQTTALLARHYANAIQSQCTSKPNSLLLEYSAYPSKGSYLTSQLLALESSESRIDFLEKHLLSAPNDQISIALDACLEAIEALDRTKHSKNPGVQQRYNGYFRWESGTDAIWKGYTEAFIKQAKEKLLGDPFIAGLEFLQSQQISPQLLDPATAPLYFALFETLKQRWQNEPLRLVNINNSYFLRKWTLSVIYQKMFQFIESYSASNSFQPKISERELFRDGCLINQIFDQSAGICGSDFNNLWWFLKIPPQMTKIILAKKTNNLVDGAPVLYKMRVEPNFHTAILQKLENGSFRLNSVQYTSKKGTYEWEERNLEIHNNDIESLINVSLDNV